MLPAEAAIPGCEEVTMRWWRYGLAVFFVVAGVNHFLRPALYVSIIPPWLPFPRALNWISGGSEIAGGAGVLIPRLQRAVGWGLIALLLAVFPANIYMASHGYSYEGHPVPGWILWGRLPLQPVFAAWVYFACLRRKDAGHAGS